MIIDLSEVFPVRKSYTDIVSAATDNEFCSSRQ